MPDRAAVHLGIMRELSRRQVDFVHSEHYISHSACSVFKKYKTINSVS